MTEPAMERLDKVSTFASGGTPSKSKPEYWGGDVPWLTPKDMASFDGSTTDHVTDAAIGNGTRRVSDGTIFIAVRGMSLHTEIRVVRVDRPMTFNQDIKAILPGDIDGRYLYYALLAQKPSLLGAVEPAGHGTGVLPTEKLAATPIPVRSPKEQQAIAAVLGALDDKIELNRRTNETLSAASLALFRDWFVEFGPTRAKQEGQEPYLSRAVWDIFPAGLGPEGTPEGWATRPLDKIADFLNGLALQKYPATGDRFLPIVKIAQLRAGNTLSADRASLDVPPSYIVENQDILFSWSGSLLHRVWTGGRGALNQHLFKVTSKSYPQWFFFHWIGHHMPQFQAVAASKATTMGHIQRHHLTQAAVIDPGADLMNAANKVIAPMFERSVDNELESRTLVELRDSLLPRLMLGEFVVRDAEKMVGELT